MIFKSRFCVAVSPRLQWRHLLGRVLVLTAVFAIPLCLSEQSLAQYLDRYGNKGYDPAYKPDQTNRTPDTDPVPSASAKRRLRQALKQSSDEIFNPDYHLWKKHVHSEVDPDSQIAQRRGHLPSKFSDSSKRYNHPLSQFAVVLAHGLLIAPAFSAAEAVHNATSSDAKIAERARAGLSKNDQALVERSAGKSRAERSALDKFLDASGFKSLVDRWVAAGKRADNAAAADWLREEKRKSALRQKSKIRETLVSNDPTVAAVDPGTEKPAERRSGANVRVNPDTKGADTRPAGSRKVARRTGDEGGGAAKAPKQVLQGQFSGPFSGGTISGTITLNIRGTAVTGTMTGRNGSTRISGRVASGLYDPLTGQIAANYVGKWRESKRDCSIICSGKLRGRIVGRQSGKGFSGRWSGGGGFDNGRGTWRVSGGHWAPAKTEEIANDCVAYNAAQWNACMEKLYGIKFK
ncbi:MAG: hypothetical protein GY947_02910 [Rhodobacteraceae bacterium]|nr:hypothetical protein [Paracoccaceae bacterium]